MYDSLDPTLLHSGAVLMLAIAAEDGNVDPTEVNKAGEVLANWGRTDRVTAAQYVQQAFAELGQVWKLGGHAELDRHVWSHADQLATQLDYHPLSELGRCLRSVADADGSFDHREHGLIEALVSFFEREAGPPESLTALQLLQQFDADSRGARWVERFKARIGGTLLEVGAPGDAHATNPRMVPGIGGQQLAEARLEPVGGLEVPFVDLVRWCTDEGVGLHLQPDWTDPPGWVLRYGELWSFRAFEGSLDGPGPGADQMYLDQLMPHWARERLARVFERYGLPGRQVAHLTAPSGEPALAFDAPPSFLPDPSKHDALEKEIRSMTPPGMVLVLIDPTGTDDYPWNPL